MALDYAKAFDPRPYTASRSSQAEMNTDLSEWAAKAMDTLPTDQRDLFRERVSEYKSIEDLPDDLRAILVGAGLPE